MQRQFKRRFNPFKRLRQLVSLSQDQQPHTTRFAYGRQFFTMPQDNDASHPAHSH